MLEYLEKLSELSGPSGDESRVVEYIASVVRPYVDELYTDELGTLYAVKHRGERRVMLDAHTDEIAVIVTEIREDGTMNYQTHLGNDPRMQLGKTVAVGAKCIPGVIRTKNECRYTGKDEYLGHEKLCIDIGTTSREETEKYVTIGDYACFATNSERLGDKFVTGKAYDDRCGCAIIMELLKNDYPCDLYASFSVQEEMGLRGAISSVQRIRPEFGIAFEGTGCNDLDIGDTGVQTVCALEKGPVVTYMDNFTVINEKFFNSIKKTAEENNIPYQLRNGVRGGTDGHTIQTTYAGAKTCVLSVPCRYIHSPRSITTIDDFINTYKLADALLRKALYED